MENNSIKILHVETESTYAAFLKCILIDDIKTHLFKLTQRKTLQEARESLKENSFDFLLIDTLLLEDNSLNDLKELFVLSGDAPGILLGTKDNLKQTKNATKKLKKSFFLKKQVDENALPFSILCEYKKKLRKTDNFNKRKEKFFGNENKSLEDNMFKLLIDNSSDIVTVVNSLGKILYKNDGLKRTLDYDPKEFIGEYAINYIHPEDKVNAVAKLSQILFNRNESTIFNLKFKHNDDSWRNLEVAGRCINDETDSPIIVFNSRDITERAELEESLKRESIIDTLTGVRNRKGFNELIEEKVQQAKSNSEEVFVMIADIDNLKEINDEHGHVHGDKVIQTAANVLKSTFRNEDIIARIGGDEFAVVFTSKDLNSPNAIQSRVDGRVSSINYSLGKPYKLSISLGFSLFNPNKDISISELINEADIKMYENKKQKKCKVRGFSQKEDTSLRK